MPNIALVNFMFLGNVNFKHIYSKTCIKRSHKTGDLLKESQFIWHFLWEDKKMMTFKYRWLLNRGDSIEVTISVPTHRLPSTNLYDLKLNVVNIYEIQPTWLKATVNKRRTNVILSLSEKATYYAKTKL